MLAGLAALAIPILIHLLLKRKKQRLRFSTIQFFIQRDDRSSKRRKLRNLLLLAVRLLLLAVLVLAFARPYFAGPTGAAAGREAQLAVFVIDASASMQAADGGRTRWNQALQHLRKLLSELGPQDRAALVRSASQAEVVSGPAPPDAVAALADSLTLSSGGGKLAEALQLAANLVRHSDAKAATLYVLSDLQVTSCADLAAYPLPQDLQVKPVKVGDVLTPNLAIVQFNAERKLDQAASATIAAFSDEIPQGLQARLTVDGQLAGTSPLNFGTSQIARIEFPARMVKPGWHNASLSLERADALPLDNVRYDAFFVPQPLRALVVETRPGKRPFEQETFFLTTALDPLQTNSAGARFAVETLLPDALVAKLAAPGSSTNFEAVLLPGLRIMPSGLGGQLSEYVQGGGGLVLFLGSEANSASYNAQFGQLLPAIPGRVEVNRAAETERKWHLEEYDLNGPIFSVFRSPNSGNLAIPEFSSRFALTVQPGTSVPARFGEGVPAVVTKAVGKGMVAMVNTSADTAWTDWPKHKTFLPWLHSLCAHIAHDSGANRSRAANQFISGQDNEIQLSAKGQKLRLQPVGQTAVNVTSDDLGRVQHQSLDTPGIYTISDNTGRELRRIIVNPPPQESDLTSFTGLEFPQKLVRDQSMPSTSLEAGLFSSKEQPRDFARTLLMAGLILLIAESFLSNRTYA